MITAKTKRPSLQWYPSDWRGDTDLQSCSLAARGLWHEMCCLMHGMTPYGHLRVGGKPVSVERLALMVAAQLGEVKRLLVELESATVFSRTEDGTIYSRRMVRDEKFRQSRIAGGLARCWKDAGKDALHDAEHKSSINPASVPAKNQHCVEEEEEEERKKVIKSGRGTEPEFSIPDWVPMEPWLDYVLARLAKRAPIKAPSQAQYCIAKLKKLRDLGHDPAEVLAQSIANGWTGLFPVSQEKNANGKPTIAEQTRRNAAIALERHEARAANLGGAE